MKTLIKLALKLLPANTIAGIIADYVTQALQKIKDKDRMAKVSEAVSATGEAVKVVGEAVHDCEITEDEVNLVSDKVKLAVEKIVEAAR